MVAVDIVKGCVARVGKLQGDVAGEGERDVGYGLGETNRFGDKGGPGTAQGKPGPNRVMGEGCGKSERVEDGGRRVAGERLRDQKPNGRWIMAGVSPMGLMRS